MPAIKTALESLSKQIDVLLNPPAAQPMTAEEFTAYAKAQLQKAQAESGDPQKARLEALKSVIAATGDAFAKGAEKVDVPVFADPPAAPPVAAVVVTTPAPVVTTTAPAAPAEPAPAERFMWPHDLAEEVAKAPKRTAGN